jgi:hypothetical protein
MIEVKMLNSLLPLAVPLFVAVGAERGGPSVTAIEFPSVEAARKALLLKRNAKPRYEQGWLVVNDPGTQAIWSFVPVGHDAYPAVVKRTVVERRGQLVVEMDIRCEASKVACDALVAQFQALNNEAQRITGEPD